MLNFLQYGSYKSSDFIRAISNYNTLIIVYEPIYIHTYIDMSIYTSAHVCGCIYTDILHIFKLFFFNSNTYILSELKQIKYKCIRTNGWKQIIDIMHYLLVFHMDLGNTYFKFSALKNVGRSYKSWRAVFPTLSLLTLHPGKLARDMASCFILIPITTDKCSYYRNDDIKPFLTPLPNWIILAFLFSLIKQFISKLLF